MSIQQNYGEPVNTESANITEEQLKQFKQLFPQVFSEGDKINWEKMREALGDIVDDKPERYSFSWAGKKDAIRLLQTPTRATLQPCPDESEKFDKTKNFFIEGDNLEVLKLLYKSYFGRVKMIYIDPPYNKEKDFIYPDNFADPLETYLRVSGQKDEEGNLLTSNINRNGRIHSNWLSMMYPRLFVARQLLKDDGVLFVSIDDKEVHNLRLLLNEIFGEENCVGVLVWEKKKKGSFLANSLTNIKEYVLVYSKNSSVFKGLIGEIKTEKETYPCVNPSNKREKRTIKAGISSKYRKKNYFLPKGSKISAGTMDMILHSDLVIKNGKLDKDFIIEGNWRYTQRLLDEYAEKNELYLTEDLYLRRIVVEPRYKTLKDLLPRIGTSGKVNNFNLNNLFLDGWGSNEDGNEEIIEIFGNKATYDYSKPSKLIKKLTASIRDKDFIVLDFFAGSSTTAQSILNLNREDGGRRQFIMVQLPELCEEGSEPFKAGFKTISDIGKERLRRVISKMKGDQKDGEDLGFKVFKLAESNFEAWKGVKENKPEEYIQQMGWFVDPLKPGWKEENVIYEVAIKEGYGLNIDSERVENVTDNTVYKVADADKDQFFYVCLDKAITLEALHPLALTRDHLFICRDVALNDETAANLALQCRLKTI
jgi:adenine-specific DNA-methyltransferase